MQSLEFYKRLLDHVRSAPGVRSATLSSIIPFDFNGDVKSVVPEGRALARGEQPPTAFSSTVSDGYFQTFRIPILHGRGFLPSDKSDSPRIAVVNEHFADHFWPHGDAIGKRFHLQDAKGPLVQIVGIAKQAKYLWIGEPPTDFVYLPFSQQGRNTVTLVAESTAGDPSLVASVLRKVVHSLDPNMPAFNVRTMQNLYTQRAVQTPSVIVKAVAGMGALALTLAVIGLYGLVAYSVTRRTREIGIRMAIGADQRGVLQMVLRQGLVLALSGTALGLVIGSVVSRLIGSMFILSFGNTNPAFFLAVALPLLTVAMAAVYLPARRASRVDPMTALRDE